MNRPPAAKKLDSMTHYGIPKERTALLSSTRITRVETVKAVQIAQNHTLMTHGHRAGWGDQTTYRLGRDRRRPKEPEHRLYVESSRPRQRVETKTLMPTTIRELGNRRRIATADVDYAHRWTWICEEVAAEFDCDPSEIEIAEIAGREVLIARGTPVAFTDDREVTERLQRLERTFLEQLRRLRRPAPSLRRGAPRRRRQPEA
jgi:hypothetical protein